MFEFLISVAENPMTPWAVLAGASIVFVIECWKASPRALMGDLFAEGLDD